MLGFFLHSPIVQVAPNLNASAETLVSYTKYKLSDIEHSQMRKSISTMERRAKAVSALSLSPFGSAPSSSPSTSSPFLSIFTLHFSLLLLSSNTIQELFAKFCALDLGYRPNISQVSFGISNLALYIAQKFLYLLRFLDTVFVATVNLSQLGSVLSPRLFLPYLNN